MPRSGPHALWASHVRTHEVTPLDPKEERAFQRWATANEVSDVDHPEAYYDYRGFWQASGGVPVQFGVDHFPDTFKQHGHPTFSQESQYSRGYWDGGLWIPGTETLLEQPPMAVSHRRGQEGRR